jgi:hypothetical protein
MIKLRLNALIESTVFPVVLLLTIYYFNQQDPLLLHASFPWVWLLPILIALRYGLAGSLITVAVYVLAMFFTVRYRYFDWASYQVWFLGGVAATVICNEYHAYWQRKQHKIIRKSDYLENRLESLSRAYSAMRISHDRLEESLITKPVTLRGAIADLRAVLAENQGQLTTTSARQLLAILANTAMIGKGALYLMENNKLSATPIGTIGPADTLRINDPLVTRCLKSQETFYVAINTLGENDVSDYQAVVPMMTADQRMMGLLTVSELPFSSMTDESLRIMTLLMAYFADEIYSTQAANAILHAYPDCPPFFAMELLRLQHLYKISGIDSTLFIYTFPQDQSGHRLRHFIKQQIRGVDVFWERQNTTTLQLIILMPLTLNGMVSAYTSRIDTIIKGELNTTLQAGVLSMRHDLLSFLKKPSDLIEALNYHDMA